MSTIYASPHSEHNIVTDNLRLSEHYAFFLQPYQVNRLRRLKQTANSLFLDSQAITLIDLLYAALWKRLAALQPDHLTAMLTVIEDCSSAQQSPAAGRNIVKNTLVCEAGILTQQPLVEIAQHIRSYIRAGDSDAHYEGWIVDSLPQPLAPPVSAVDYTTGLTCTTLSPPSLQQVELEHAYWRNNGGGPVQERARRICCINSPPQVDGALLIDLQLPSAEIALFKAQYGDSNGVPPQFYEN